MTIRESSMQRRFRKAMEKSGSVLVFLVVFIIAGASAVNKRPFRSIKAPRGMYSELCMEPTPLVNLAVSYRSACQSASCCRTAVIFLLSVM